MGVGLGGGVRVAVNGEAFVKIQKKNFFFFWGGGSRVRGSDWGGGGVRVDGNGESKLF